MTSMPFVFVYKPIVYIFSGLANNRHCFIIIIMDKTEAGLEKLRGLCKSEK